MSNRAAVPGLRSRYPIGEQLPALYADDDFAQRFTAGLDTVLAPVLSTLDNLPAYFDPRLTPPDFVVWLASWLGIETDETWPQALRRTVVGQAMELHRWQGTRRGLTERLWLCLGVRAQIVDGGGAVWSTTAGTALPAEPPGELLVRVWPGRLPSGGTVDEEQVRAVVADSCPVHLPWRVEVLPGPPDGWDAPAGPDSGPGSGPESSAGGGDAESHEGPESPEETGS